MSLGSHRSRALRCLILGVAAGGLLSACNREMRGTLRDLGIHVDEPTTEASPVQGTPAPVAPAPATPPHSAAAPVTVPATVATTITPAPVTNAATVATTNAAPASNSVTASPATAVPPAAATPAPATAPVPLGDLHSGWIAGTIGEVPQPMISIKSSGSPYGTVQILFHSRVANQHGTIKFSTGLLDSTIYSVETEHEKSTVFAIKLPVGDYLIDSLRFTDSNDLSHHDCKVEKKLAVPFTVIPGKVNYLGALLTSADWGDTRFGPMAPRCGYFIVSDQSARDQVLLRERYSQLAGPLEVHLLAGNTPEAAKYFRSK